MDVDLAFRDLYQIAYAQHPGYARYYCEKLEEALREAGATTVALMFAAVRINADTRAKAIPDWRRGDGLQ